MSTTASRQEHGGGTEAWPRSFRGKPYGPGEPGAIAREGWPIIAGFVVAAVMAAAVAYGLGGLGGAGVAKASAAVVGGLGLLLSVWAVWFFRDPRREPETDEAGAVICPADGVIVADDEFQPPAELGGPGGAALPRMRRISIFMNVFDVHVNRSPAAGTVEQIHYRRGAFVNASFDKASVDNERAAYLLRLKDGRLLVVVQIAGLVARRIVGKVAVGDRLEAGQRFGLIRFGSRVDVYLPAGAVSAVRMRQRVWAGRTVIGRLMPGPEPARRDAVIASAAVVEPG